MILQQARIALVAEHVLVGADLDHAAAGLGLLHVGTGRHQAALRRLALPLRLQLDQQAAAVAQPGVTTPDDGVERAVAQPTRTARGHVDQPQLVAGGLRIDAVEGDVALVRRPAETDHRQRLRQSLDSQLLSGGDFLQPEIGAEGEPAGGMAARVDAQARQLQLRLGDHVNARQRGYLHQGQQIAARTDRDVGAAGCVDDGAQGGRRQLVTGVGGGRRRGRRRARQGGRGQQAHRQGQGGDTGHGGHAGLSLAGIHRSLTTPRRAGPRPSVMPRARPSLHPEQPI